ncbi:P22AR C-terminal domain-containing protein [Avibacterium paragallinarum]|uniref:Antirepressor protein n=1 Tax=Avibacterium paragallinarum TaxID=728 RepID=A0A377IWJ9_AVIPA|nr:P22AR C-terminal domain-containing protein [Avibacterium paragallinarum]POY47782.1 phage repressor protein/antirepressor Ant [Avibacterium paragallinarum]RZN74383.1 phage repressor protein/antirepressor Ant [Avibacterium paragallinarum]CDG00412.1 Putative Antirepressor protein Ant [Avibacterium paragallinarum JF4211]STO91887.1 antirepressor protein [Avibacterium paragallinarum]
MSNIITADYNGTQVFFQDDAYLNATAIAKHFNKLPNEWLRLESTQEYIDLLCKKLNTGKSRILKTTRGVNGGTWLHRRLAVPFARWLNVEFAIWCDEEIEKILIGQKQQLALPASTVDERTGLREAVNVLVAKRKLTHSEVYGFIHQRFNVEKIEQLTAEQILQAIEYVQKLTIGVEITLPSPEKKYTFEFTEYELQKLAWLWFAFKRGVGTFQHIHKAFEALGSNLSPQIYGQAYEYLSVLRSSNQILNRITEEFEADPMTSWRVLTHLREFNPKAVKIDF